MRVLFIALFIETSLVAATRYITEQKGQKYAEDQTFSLYYKEEGTNAYVSPWHDIPLYSDEDSTNKTLNMIVEIPRFTQAKFEIHREFGLNPIKQDVKDNKLRYIYNIFPWHGHVCNYGAFPQTWENPFHQDRWTNLRGDKDPVDVCEVGEMPVPTGTVLPVRVLGILALLDSGETDWKVIVMNSAEAKSKGIEDMDDLIEKSPGIAEAVKRFFTVYKVPAHKPRNKFAYNGEIKGTDLAWDVIEFLHGEWKEMMLNCSISSKEGEFGSFNTVNTKVTSSPCRIDQTEAQKEVNKQAAYRPDDDTPRTDIHGWSFVNDPTSDHSESHVGSLTVILVSLLLLL